MERDRVSHSDTDTMPPIDTHSMPSKSIKETICIFILSVVECQVSGEESARLKRLVDFKIRDSRRHPGRGTRPTLLPVPPAAPGAGRGIAPPPPRGGGRRRYSDGE